MKVVNWHKWQKTKWKLVGVLVFVALWFSNGLEDKPGTTPSLGNPLVAIPCLVFAGLLVHNISVRDKQRGKGW